MEAAAGLLRCLTDSTTFDARTLDALVHAVRLTTSITDVYENYLDPTPINTVI